MEQLVCLGRLFLSSQSMLEGASSDGEGLSVNVTDDLPNFAEYLQMNHVSVTVLSPELDAGVTEINPD